MSMSNMRKAVGIGNRGTYIVALGGGGDGAEIGAEGAVLDIYLRGHRRSEARHVCLLVYLFILFIIYCLFFFKKC